MEGVINKTFGKLTVIEEVDSYITPSTGKKDRRWRCLCQCGGETVTSKRKLLSGHTRSCGCIKDIYISHKHGKANKIPEYSVWNSIKSRCNNIKDKFYDNYGGRGITYDPRWESFENFLEDMGERPSNKHTIERVNVNSGYSKENCIWTDNLSLQAFNKASGNSSVGKTGVSSRKRKDGTIVYCVEISKNKKTRYKTVYTLDDAITLRKSWEVELYGFELEH